MTWHTPRTRKGTTAHTTVRLLSSSSSSCSPTVEGQSTCPAWPSLKPSRYPSRSGGRGPPGQIRRWWPKSCGTADLVPDGAPTARNPAATLSPSGGRSPLGLGDEARGRRPLASWSAASGRSRTEAPATSPRSTSSTKRARASVHSAAARSRTEARVGIPSAGRQDLRSGGVHPVVVDPPCCVERSRSPRPARRRPQTKPNGRKPPCDGKRSCRRRHFLNFLNS